MVKKNESGLVTQPKESFLSPLEQKAMAATGVMTSMMEAVDSATGEKFLIPRGMCTATAFKRRGNVYYFITAAHCAGIAGPTQGDMCLPEDSDRGFIRVMPWKWFIDLSEGGLSLSVLHEAELYSIGHTGQGDDFAVFKVKLQKPIPVMPLALWDPRVGEPVINVAAPANLGKQLFRGHVSREYFSTRGDKDAGKVLFQLPCAPGSSGSSIISQSQKGIIAILNESISISSTTDDGKEFVTHLNSAALPVSRFVKFWKLSEKGEYPYPAFVPLNFQPWMLGLEDIPELNDACGNCEGCECHSKKNIHGR